MEAKPHTFTSREKENVVIVPNEDQHHVEFVEARSGPPGFWSLRYGCTCGKVHFWLLLEEEIELAIALLGNLRDMRKRQDETIIQEDYIEARPQTSLDLGS